MIAKILNNTVKKRKGKGFEMEEFFSVKVGIFTIVIGTALIDSYSDRVLGNGLGLLAESVGVGLPTSWEIGCLVSSIVGEYAGSFVGSYDGVDDGTCVRSCDGV